MKSSTYMDRALKAKDPRYARVLGKLGYNRSDVVDGAPEDAAPPVPPIPPVTEPPVSQSVPEGNSGSTPEANEGSAVVPDIAALRALYQEKFGKRAFPGWSADELIAKMAAAQGED